MVLRRLAALVFALVIQSSASAWAQTQAPAAATPAAPPASSDQMLKPEELEALVAPIALYPDTLLSLVLMASTYPLEVVQADRWLKENKTLKDDALKAAADKQQWDDSVKSLVATPDVVSMMSSKLEWTVKLGDAVLAQQPDVMDAIQRLRAKADGNNKLTSTKEQKVTKSQGQSGKQYIAIEQTNPDTVYVPYYDPAVVYGGWPYPAYPPYYFGYPGYIGAGLIGAGLAFGAGWALGRWASGGNYWGGGCNWNVNNININRPRVNPLNGSNFQHRPEHRQGVRYNNSNVRQKFGDNNRGSVSNRMDYRGRGGNQVLNPDRGGAGQRPGDRPGAGQRPGGDRPGAGAGQRPGGDRPSAGQRPSGGGKPSAGQRPSGGSKPSAGQRPSSSRPSAGQRPSGGARPGGGNALGNVGSGRAASMQSARGRASMGGGGGGGMRAGGGGGGMRAGGGGGGGGGARGGGGGGGGRGGGGGGGGRRSDIMLKHDIVRLGRLPNGIGYYRFSYNNSNRTYVGVMAQEVQTVMPDAVVRGRDGYLRVFYDKVGVKFQTYEQWIASGARAPIAASMSH